MSHSVEETPGRRRISVLAPSIPELFVEAGRAAAEVFGRASDGAGAAWSEEVAIAAPDREALLGEWVRQLVLRSEHAGARISEHDIVYLSEGRIVANVRGSLVTRAREPVEAITFREPSITPRDGTVRASVVLQV
ncbi:archease [Anaeromyxobacter oryzae]|uniref:archease n=1 Tax=Anaeromyxobacter oryzae TaxID=2918170 RepID=UPI0020BD4E97|nr:archease [Anaeromyxobacter oryzae]